ncbi:hypothetical protein ACJX0J_023646, partial [Zea mays]
MTSGLLYFSLKMKYQNIKGLLHNAKVYVQNAKNVFAYQISITTLDKRELCLHELLSIIMYYNTRINKLHIPQHIMHILVGQNLDIGFILGFPRNMVYQHFLIQPHKHFIRNLLVTIIYVFDEQMKCDKILSEDL